MEKKLDHKKNIPVLLIRMSNMAKESISTICVILSFPCSLNIVCQLCCHNSQVPSTISLANSTAHKSHSMAHKSHAVEYISKIKV